MSKRRAFLLALVLPLLSGSHWTETSDANVKSGLMAYASGDFALAAREFRLALAGEGAREALHFDLGTALVSLSSERPTSTAQEQDLDLAIVSLRSARAKPGSALREAVDYNLGNALVLRGRFSEAVAVYRAVLVQNPEHDDARHNLELALLALHASEAGQKERVLQLRKGFGSPALAGDADADATGQGEPLTAGTNGVSSPSQGGESDSLRDGDAAAGEGESQERGQDGDKSAPSQSNGDGEPGETETERGMDVERADRPANPLPSSGSSLSLQKKLDALERRSAELRRESMLRKTTRRLRDPDKRGVDR